MGCCLILYVFWKCSSMCIYGYSHYWNITFSYSSFKNTFWRFFDCIINTSSSPPLVDLLCPWFGSCCGQLGRWDMASARSRKCALDIMAQHIDTWCSPVVFVHTCAQGCACILVQLHHLWREKQLQTNNATTSDVWLLISMRFRIIPFDCLHERFETVQDCTALRNGYWALATHPACCIN